MGASNTITITDQQLHEARLGDVIVGDIETGVKQVLYYQRNEKLFLIKAGEASLKNNIDTKGESS
jgi:hypothetical protein